jgi:hypothetical protein
VRDAIAPFLLGRWANFYVIVGSAAAALTGLQFVVVALAVQARRATPVTGIDAFSTPTIVYFSNVLLLSAVLSAPWNGLPPIAILITLCGAAGVVYSLIVTRRALNLSIYHMVLEDWIWHITLPFAAHATLLAAGLSLMQQPYRAFLAIAAASLVLLFVGIHNAWDTVTFMVVMRQKAELPDGEAKEAPPAS